MIIYDYTTAGGKNLITEYIDALPAAEKAEIFAVRQLIQDQGMEAFPLLVTRQLYKKTMGDQDLSGKGYVYNTGSGVSILPEYL